MRGVTEAKKEVGQCKGYVAPDVPVSACRIIQKIFKWETYFHCSSMRDEREFISLISPSPASYLSSFMRRTDSPTWSQWLLKKLDLNTQKWSWESRTLPMPKPGFKSQEKREWINVRENGVTGEDSTVGRQQFYYKISVPKNKAEGYN